jgi:hypothetical protein
MTETTDNILPSDRSNENQSISTVSLVREVTFEHDLGVTKFPVVETNVTKSSQNEYKSGNNSLLEMYNCSLSSNKVEQNNCSTNTSNKNVVTYRDFKEYKYYKNLVKIFPYAPNIPGMLTNVLTILIAAHLKPRHTSEIYMITLGITDFVVVVTRCTYNVWSTYIDSRSSASCKIPGFLIHVSLVYSNMILMSWTIERVVAVIFPIKLASWCSIKNTKITLVFLLLLSSLLGIPYLTEYDHYTYLTGNVLVSVCFQTEFFNTVWTHTISFYYIFIPVVSVCVCNVMIICRLSAMTKARIQMSSNQETIDKKVSENKRMTILLLTISGCFLVLHTPYAAILVFYYFYPDPTIFISEDPHFFAKFVFYSTFGYLITEFQNSVNFFLYCISGSKFRAIFLRVVCKSFMKTKEEQNSRSRVTRSTNF